MHVHAAQEHVERRVRVDPANKDYVISRQKEQFKVTESGKHNFFSGRTINWGTQFNKKKSSKEKMEE